MQPAYWHERWRVGQTGFHQTAVDSDLARHWPALQCDPHGQVLVPLCGKSCDLTWLAVRGHRVLGIEYSAIAVESYFLENGVAARREAFGKHEELSAGAVRILRGDFFDLASGDLPAIDAVYDRAALIALPPEARRRYAQLLIRLCPPGTPMLLIALEYAQHQTAGPPYSVLENEVGTHYGADFAVELLSREDILDQEPRMRAKGVTKMAQVCYSLRRLEHAYA